MDQEYLVARNATKKDPLIWSGSFFLCATVQQMLTIYQRPPPPDPLR